MTEVTFHCINFNDRIRKNNFFKKVSWFSKMVLLFRGISNEKKSKKEKIDMICIQTVHIRS